MFRNLILAIAVLAASACSYGSAVDIAPLSARLARPAAQPGDYCMVQGKAAPFTIVSHEECVPVVWNPAARTYTMVDPEDKDDSIEAAIIQLGSGLYAASIEAPEARVDRYHLQLLISKGDAFAMIGALDDEPMQTLAAKHRRLTFANDKAGRPYIASGKPGDIKTFLREAARESLREMKAEDPDETISVAVLDKAGAPDHLASKQQAKDIEAVLKAANAMTPK